jgi:hypothetical protein
MGKHWGKFYGDSYLQEFPDLVRWLNVCSRCGARGYKPELPANIYPHPNIAANELRKHFAPLALNAEGVCSECEAALARMVSGR